MEYIRDIERNVGTDDVVTLGSPSSSVFRRRAADSQQRDPLAAGSLSGCSQPAGGSDRRNPQVINPQSSKPLLRVTERSPLEKRRPPGSDDDGTLYRNSNIILDSLSSGVVLLDEHLLIVALNPAAENILGISERRARGESLLQLVDDEPEMRDILTRVIDSGDHYATELQLAPTEVNNDQRIIDCRVSPIIADDARLLVEITDITRRSQISRENALLIQHGAGRQMIRQLAHEIKNPLGGIRGAAQLLARQLHDPELGEYTDVVISETDRLATLVDTLLGPGGPSNKHPVNVHELLEYVVRLIDVDDQRQISIHRDYDPGLPDIRLDRDQIVQAFLNLVRNAIAALEGQGRLTLRSRAVTNFTIGHTRHRVIASIEIEDDGPGIPANLQDSIFYPLVTSRREGTGLGLPAAQELISRHGGLIEFESRPGRTVFLMRIPLSQNTGDSSE